MPKGRVGIGLTLSPASVTNALCVGLTCNDSFLFSEEIFGGRDKREPLGAGMFSRWREVTRLNTAVHGCTWLYTWHMATHNCARCTQLHRAARVCTWLHTAGCSYKGLYTAAHGCIGLHTSIHVYTPHTLSHKHTHPQHNPHTHTQHVHPPHMHTSTHICTPHTAPHTHTHGPQAPPPRVRPSHQEHPPRAREDTCPGPRADAAPRLPTRRELHAAWPVPDPGAPRG